MSNIICTANGANLVATSFAKGVKFAAPDISLKAGQ